jgi:hypothetical protein
MNLTAKINNKDVDLADYKLAIDVFDATCEPCCLRVVAFLLFLTSYSVFYVIIANSLTWGNTKEGCTRPGISASQAKPIAGADITLKDLKDNIQNGYPRLAWVYNPDSYDSRAVSEVANFQRIPVDRSMRESSVFNDAASPAIPDVWGYVAIEQAKITRYDQTRADSRNLCQATTRVS